MNHRRRRGFSEGGKTCQNGKFSVVGYGLLPRARTHRHKAKNAARGMSVCRPEGLPECIIDFSEKFHRNNSPSLRPTRWRTRYKKALRRALFMINSPYKILPFKRRRLGRLTDRKSVV